MDRLRSIRRRLAAGYGFLALVFLSTPSPSLGLQAEDIIGDAKPSALEKGGSEFLRVISGVDPMAGLGTSGHHALLSGPYCGVTSLYAFARMNGSEIDFQDLLRPEYIGSQDGSSLFELRDAARDHGIETRFIKHASASWLRQVSHPVILHTKDDLTVAVACPYVLIDDGHEERCNGRRAT